MSFLRIQISNYLEDFDMILDFACLRSKVICHTCDIGISCQHLTCTLSVFAQVLLEVRFISRAQHQIANKNQQQSPNFRKEPLKRTPCLDPSSTLYRDTIYIIGYLSFHRALESKLIGTGILWRQ